MTAAPTGRRSITPLVSIFIPQHLHRKRKAEGATYQESEQVENQRKVKLNLAPPIVVREPPRILIHQYPLAQTPPMPRHFPHRRKHRRQGHVIERILQDQSRALEVIAVDVDAGDPGDDATRRGDDEPVPRPATRHETKTALLREVVATVFSERTEGEDYHECVEAAEGYPQTRAGRDWFNGGIAICSIYSTAVREEDGVVDAEDKVAVRGIR
jgi:hypothetical protein